VQRSLTHVVRFVDVFKCNHSYIMYLKIIEFKYKSAKACPAALRPLTTD